MNKELLNEFLTRIKNQKATIDFLEIGIIIKVKAIQDTFWDVSLLKCWQKNIQ